MLTSRRKGFERRDGQGEKMKTSSYRLKRKMEEVIKLLQSFSAKPLAYVTYNTCFNTMSGLAHSKLSNIKITFYPVAEPDSLKSERTDIGCIDRHTLCQ